MKYKIEHALAKDRPFLLKQWRKLNKNQLTGAQKANFFRILNRSINSAYKRRLSIPDIHYPSLPISEHIDKIKGLLNKHQVIIVAGETGSGKSTQLPKICLEQLQGTLGYIGHTQPRRIAAKSIANRLGDELQSEPDHLVASKVRFSDHTKRDTLIKVMTDGVLLAEMQHDRFLNAYDTIIIDEAHERSLNIDFLLGCLKRILLKRKDLKVIITSATIDHQRFGEFFNAPVLEVSGRYYPVEIRYNDYTEMMAEGMSQPEAIEDSLNELAHEKEGDVLVFFASEREINETANHLAKTRIGQRALILPLYARLSQSQQQHIFQPTQLKRVILATNIAETSITVPGIRYVIDTGFARVSRYNYKNKVQRLPIERISQASAQQRAGRCGRIAPGICIRMYGEDDYLARKFFTDPEIQRTNLASIILQMLKANLGDIRAFPFIDPPEPGYIKDGFKLLYELGAIDENHSLTNIGHFMAQLTVDPKFACMLWHAHYYGCLKETLIVTTFLSIQDPRERPAENQAEADRSHKQDEHPKSDFLTIVNLWHRLTRNKSSLSHNQMKKWCRNHFLNYIRWREWLSLYHQIKTEAINETQTINEQPALYDDFHKTLASGLFSYVGFNYEDKVYLGPRGIKFYIFPASGQFKITPKWILAGELVETTKLYGKNIAQIKPEWMEEVASHLVKKHYTYPHWRKKQANVFAYERVTLFGLDIIVNRLKPYAGIDLKVSREIFIQEALVEGNFDCEAEFFQYNLNLMQNINELEERSRRRDILVDGETLYAYYDELIPAYVCNGPSFFKWYRQLNKKDKDQLFFKKSKLMQGDVTVNTQSDYPDYLKLGPYYLPLKYRFQPDSEDDGVTLIIPVELVYQIPLTPLSWLVPGLLHEKIMAMMRTLPKKIRKACVPIPHFANAIMQIIEDDSEHQNEDFERYLLKCLGKLTGLDLDETIFDSIELPLHLKMNHRIVDKKGNILAEGRDIHAIQNKLADAGQTQAQTTRLGHQYHQKGLTDWPVGELSHTIDEYCDGFYMAVYPALIDQGSSVDLITMTDPEQASKQNQQGILKLLMLQTPAYVTSIQDLLKKQALIAQYYPVKAFENQWQHEIIEYIYHDVFKLDEIAIYNHEQFHELINHRHEQLLPKAREVIDRLNRIFENYQTLQKWLKRKNLPLNLIGLYQSVQYWVDDLIFEGFVRYTSFEWLGRIEYHLKAQLKRLEKAPLNLDQDKQYGQALTDLQHKLNHQMNAKHLSRYNADILKIKWLFHELWISWYDQPTGTIEPVSPKRIERQIAALST